MTIAELHPAIREALAIHEACRTIGIFPDHIFARPTTTELFVTVKRDGREFNALAGSCTLTLSEFTALWAASTRWWNAEAKEEERREIWETSKVFQDKVRFLIGLLGAGIEIHRGRDA